MKKWIFLFLLMLSLFLQTGCADIKRSAPSENSAYTVTDDEGRTVSLLRKPERIVSLAYGTDEILAAVVPLSRIRAFSRYAGDPGISFITEEEKRAVGCTVSGRLEEIVAQQPDLVILTKGTGQEVISSLADMGIPVYISRNPHTWADVENKVRGIASVAGEPEAGQRVIDRMREKRRQTEDRLAPITKDKEKTAMGLSFSGIVGVSGGMFDHILDMAHIRNGAAEAGFASQNAALSKEAVLAVDPDVLLLPTWEFDGNINTNAEQLKTEILGDPAYADVKAVKTGQVVFLPDRYRYVTSQHIAESIEEAAKAVYPELWSGGE